MSVNWNSFPPHFISSWGNHYYQRVSNMALGVGSWAILATKSGYRKKLEAVFRFFYTKNINIINNNNSIGNDTTTSNDTDNKENIENIEEYRK